MANPFPNTHHLRLTISIVLTLFLAGCQAISDQSKVVSPSREQYNALRQQYLQVLDQSDPGVVLKQIRAGIKTDPVLSYYCHDLLHEIGKAAFKKYNDFGKALQYQDEICVSGYIHGVMEGFFSGRQNIEDLVTVAGSECKKLPENSYSRWECFHGIGHGFMYFDDNDLPKSLGLCERYDGMDLDACTNGIFMENFNADQKEHFSKYLKDNDPLYPCQEQKKEYKFGCSMNAPIHLLNSTKDDYSALITACQKAEPELQEGCYYGLGAQSVRRNALNIPFSENLCEKIPSDMKGQCLDGMLSYLIGQRALTLVAQGQALCEEFKLENRASCQAGLVRFKNLFMDGNGVSP